ncbi:MAG TPA: GNAT family N-acetyltransferase [Bacteroidales bacterium]|nr:GNAT family N-acetyltransferase [Bacteroidales bacterium]HPS62151.1 GNAT family N-acetyltransferase [Bacteroidales bacterium]
MHEDLLTGKRIRLRALEPGDIDRLYDWENDPSVWKVSNTFAPFSRFQLEQYVLQSQNDIFSNRQLRLMIVTRNAEGAEEGVGAVDLFDFDPVHGRAGVGILIGEPFRMQGYASEALSLLVRYAFSTLWIHQLYCNISAGNTASLALFEKHGFVRCGIKRDWNRNGSGWEDEYMLQRIGEP